MKKGIIALDIDGTITHQPHVIAPRVLETLSALHHKGWHLLFITGRSFSWAVAPLKRVQVPYGFAVHNGALLLQMPEEELLFKQYLDRSLFPAMNRICQKYHTDFVIYGGKEAADRCFYRPHAIDPYLLYRAKRLEEEWIAVDDEKKSPATFPAIKCFGPRKKLESMAVEVAKELGLHVPVIQDPVDRRRCVLQMTCPHISKGEALEQYCQIKGLEGPIIAAGDDWNDLPLLERADVKIVMATAPKDLRKMATIVAAPASKEGIIAALEAAVRGNC